MIIIGYPGVGKSTVAHAENRIIDLESRYFHGLEYNLGEEPPYWEKRYCDVAIDLSNQGYTVCVSSHECVVSYLSEHSYEFSNMAAVVYPSNSDDIRINWIKRLEDRYYETRRSDKPHSSVEKDYRAWQRAKTYYDYDIMYLSNSPFYKYVIDKIQYDFADVVKCCKNALAKKFMNDMCDRMSSYSTRVTVGKEDTDEQG